MNLRLSVQLGVGFLLIAIGASFSGGWNSFTRNMVLFCLGYFVALVMVAFEETKGEVD